MCTDKPGEQFHLTRGVGWCYFRITDDCTVHCKKSHVGMHQIPMFYNGGAEPKDVGVGIFLPPRRLVRATVVHVGISGSFFYSVLAPKEGRCH